MADEGGDGGVSRELSEPLPTLDGSAPHRMAFVKYTPAEPARGAHPVVCVHGLTRNSSDFDILARSLQRRGYTVYCVDIVGRGRSDYLAVETNYGYPQYLADMAAWLQQQSLPRVHWVGTSMGGLIGMCIAATPPEAGRTVEFVSLTINDVGPFVPAAALDRLADYVGKAAVFDDLAQAEAAFRARFKPFHPVTDAQWCDLTRNSVTTITEEEAAADAELAGCAGKLRPNYDRRIGHAFKPGEGRDVDMWGIFDAVQSGPLLLIRGADSDLLSAEVAEAMMSDSHAPAVKQRKLQTVEHSGHAPSLFSEEQCAWIGDWIEAAEAEA